MSPQGPLSNQKPGNKYLLGELLGEGGFGAVYKAQNLLLNRLQAIKVILEKHFSEPKFRERFIREAQTLASLSHPNILPVYDFEIEGNTAYLVMPYISGGTLQGILRQLGPLSLLRRNAMCSRLLLPWITRMHRTWYISISSHLICSIKMEYCCSPILV